MNGKLIAIEGIDGAGTTTQAERLYQKLMALRIPSHLVREPSEGPVGALLRQILRRRIVLPGMTSPQPPGVVTMSLLFAADRCDLLESEVGPNLQEGITVVSDRSVFSSLAYQSLGGADLDWLAAVNRFAAWPDLTFILDTDPDTAEQRRSLRHQRPEIFEENELQKNLAAFYRGLPERFPDRRFVIVDGNQRVDEIFEACWRAVEKLLANP